VNKILIIDDDRVLSLYYQEELAEEGYDVVTSEDCEHCVRAIAGVRPDLVLLGAHQRQCEGLDKLQDIRNVYYDLAVILSSQNPDDVYDPRCMAADYFVLKTSDVANLKRRVQMAFEARTWN
jgi:DNA-binding response OmpR family regulator